MVEPTIFSVLCTHVNAQGGGEGRVIALAD